MKKLFTLWFLALAMMLAAHLPAQQAYVFFTQGYRATPQRFDLSDPTSARIIDGNLDQASFVLSTASLTSGKAYAYTGVSFFNMTMPACFSQISFSQDSIHDQMLVPYNMMDYLFYDMAYDNSGSALYAIANSRSDNTQWGKDLLKVNLTEGDDLGTYERVGQFSEDLCALAVDYAGNMYGVGSSGNFYLVDKDNAALTLIGSTGLDVVRDYQSMEFDHSSGILYWTANTSSSEKALYTVDLLSGKATKVGSFAQAGDFVNGLSIPFIPEPTVPGHVTGFSFGSDGADLSLTWTCPILDFSGKDLSGTMQVDIYRDGVKIFTKTDLVPGTTLTEKLTDQPTGLHIYRIVASNASGSGPGMPYRVMVGNDVPAASSRFDFEAFEDSVCLSWASVTDGKFGGVIDKASLKYRLTRYPDSVVYEVGSDTTWVDRSIPRLDNYYYELMAYTSDGEGVPLRVGPVMAGSPYDGYFACGFNSARDFNAFTILDADGDFRTWEYSEFMGQKGAFYRAGTATNDDYLVLPPVRLQAGVTYSLRYDVGTPYYDFTEQVEIRVGSGPTADALSKVVATKKYTLDPSSTDAVTFSVTQSGVYYLAFRSTRDEYSSGLFLSNIILQPTGSYNDVSCEVIKNPGFLREGEETELQVYVRNLGKMAVTSCMISFLDAQGQTIGQPVDAGSISAGKADWMKVRFTPARMGSLDLRAVVHYLSDESAVNDTSLALHIEVSPSCMDYMPLPNGGIRQNGVPVHLGSSSSASQFILTSQEMGFAPGQITHLSFDYENMNGADADRPLVIYLANVEESSLSSGWIAQDRFTEVYNGPVHFVRTRNIVEIEFTTPFSYTGKNVCVMVVAEPHSQFYGSMHYWLSHSSRNVCRYWFYQNGDASASFDFSQPGTLAEFSPDIALRLSSCQGGSLSGKVVKASDGSPLEGATVKVEGTGLEVTTGPDGSWAFPFVQASDDTLKVLFQAYSYKDSLVKLVFEKDTVLDVALRNRDRYDLSGEVVDVMGEPVEGAQVRISGYGTYTALTDVSGKFLMQDCYEYDQYLLEVFAQGKELFQRNGVVVDRPDSQVAKVELKDMAYAPRNVKAEEKDDVLTVSWEKTDSLETYRYDNGKVYLAYGDESGTEKTVLGAVYRTPARLTSMSWMTVPYYGKLHSKVNVFVFALDKEGMPTSTVLYSKMDVPNVDSLWMTHTFDTEVWAPDGFMVALSYRQGSDGYLSIANDYQDPQVVGGYRFVPNTQYYSSDYTTGKFETVESMGFSSSMFIRAHGTTTGLLGFEIMEGETAQAFDNRKAAEDESYEVWRVPFDALGSVGSWALVKEVSSQQFSCEDEGWDGLQQGMYYYAVKAVYPGDVKSEAVFSNLVMKDMMAKVTVKVKANSGESTQGLKVSLTHLQYAGYAYQLTVGADGTVVSDMLKGSYKVDVSGNPAFSFQTSIEDVLDNEVEMVLTVKEFLCDPVIVGAVQQGADACELTWTNPCVTQKVPVRYVTYLEGDSVGETTSMSFRFSGLSLGSHQLGVQAVYHTGRSAISTTGFTVTPLANQADVSGEVLLYPNPATQKVWVEGSFRRVEVMDLYGRVCLQMESGQPWLDVEDLPSGIYLVRLYLCNGQVSTVKLVVR